MKLLFSGAMRLLGLQAKEKDLQNQMDCMKMTTKKWDADKANVFAKTSFELVNTKVLIHSAKTKRDQK